MKNNGILFICICWVMLLYSCAEDTEGLKDLDKENEEPNKWPGHLESLGSKQKIEDVEILTEWPSPIEFFRDFLDKSRPVLFKGLAKNSPAFSLWTDEYLANHEGSDKEQVYVEPDKKENRTKGGKEIPFKEFVNVYQSESIYMVHGLPVNIRKDVLIPSPLRCEETRRLLTDCVTWFSSGGTKSVLHHDDLDNINCLYRGSKKLLFIDPVKNKEFLPPDVFQKGYSDIDVDKIDFEKYPKFRFVDKFIQASMEEGDCLFIPFHWFHQVNSFANQDGQNVAVNVWFKHTNGHEPRQCDIPENEATVDKYKFSELEKIKNEKEDPYHIPDESLLSILESFLEKTQKKRANFKTFVTVLKKTPYLTEYDLTKVTFTPDFERYAKALFNAIDVTRNGIINIRDFDYIDNGDHRDIYAQAIQQKYEQLIAYLHDFVSNYDDDIPMKEEEVVKAVKRDEL